MPRNSTTNMFSLQSESCSSTAILARLDLSSQPSSFSTGTGIHGCSHFPRRSYTAIIAVKPTIKYIEESLKILYKYNYKIGIEMARVTLNWRQWECFGRMRDDRPPRDQWPGAYSPALRVHGEKYHVELVAFICEIFSNMVLITENKYRA